MKTKNHFNVRQFCLLMGAILFYFQTLIATAIGQTFYVRQSAPGLNDGTDWNNAFTSLPVSLLRGATYLFADGNYGSLRLGTPEAGVTPITLRKATTTDHGTETGWVSSYGDDQAMFSEIRIDSPYWILDGVTGSGSDPRGFKIANPPGLGSGCIWSTFSFPAIAAKHHLRIRCTEFTQTTLHSSALMSLFLSETQGSLLEPNLLVENCYFHDCGALHVKRNAGNYDVYHDNVFERNALLDDSIHKAMMKWDSDCSHVRIYRNTFKDWQGYSVTGGLVLGGSDTAGSVMSDWMIYNNVFVWSRRSNPGGIHLWGGGSRAIGGLDSSVTRHDSVRVYNNTFVDISDSGACNLLALGVWGSGNEVINNVFVRSSATIVGGLREHNVYFSGRTPSGLGTLETVLVEDPTVASLSGNFQMRLSLPGRRLDSSFSDDFLRKVRGNWDVGAFEGQDRPAPVRNLRVLP